METKTEISIINAELDLKSPILSAMRERILPLYEKGKKEVLSAGDKARKAVEAYNKAVALELAALPTDDKGKLNPEQFDGFKTPVEVATKVYGFGQKTAYALLSYGKKCLDETMPKEYRALTPSNADAISGAKLEDVKKALSSGEIGPETSQKALKEWAAAHRKTETKTGKARTVTTYTVYKGAAMVKAPHGDITEDDFKASFGEGYAVLFMDKYTFSPDDAPNKKLPVRRYVAVSPELNAEVFTLIPTYQTETAKPEHVQRAEEFENGMIQKFMDSHPNATREDAIATLKELGMM